MAVDLSSKVLDVAVWIWLLVFVQFFIVGGSLFYVFRERVKKKYYEFRFPEKLLKVVIHYKTNQYREFWRVIPDEKTFNVGGKRYEFSDKNLIKENDFFTTNDGDKTTIKVSGKKYYLEDELKLKKRKGKYPEVHYFYNVPSPIKFDYTTKDVKLTSSQLEEFQENDLFKKLLTLREERKLLTMILIVSLIGAIGTVFMALRMFEVL